jgi:hypothetical protein
MQYHMCSTRLLLVNVLAVQVYHVRLNLHCPSDSIAKLSPLSYTHWHLITVIALYCVRQPHTILSFSAFADPSSVRLRFNPTFHALSARQSRLGSAFGPTPALEVLHSDWAGKACSNAWREQGLQKGGINSTVCLGRWEKCGKDLEVE